MKGRCIDWTWLVKGLIEELGRNLTSVCVFGSVARGEAEEGSDLDVLVVVRELPECIGERLRLSAKLVRKIRPPAGLPRPISPVLLTPDEVNSHPPILLDIVVDGLIVYDPESVLKKALSDLRRKLRELGARRVKTKRGWYWLLKPNAKFGEVVEL